MNRKLISLCILAFLFVSKSSFSQQETKQDTATYPYWIEMMQDESVPLPEVQKAFYSYWKNRKITKGSGYKPFKRWEWRMQNLRTNPDGTRKAADHVWNAWKNSQKSPSSLAGNWKSIGPSTIPMAKGYKGLGRINAIGFHPTNESVYYIGAPSGGLWKTTDGGSSWNSNTDNLPTLGVSSIIVDRANPETVLIGTGDRDAGDAEGLGVMKSTDGGLTWQSWNSGMGNKTVGRMIQHPSDANILYAATNGGIYKSTNAGSSWTSIKSGNFNDIVFKPNNPAILYACSSGSFYRSTDNGATWSSNATGLSSGQRMVVAVTAANPEYVYLLQSKSDNGFKALYRSTDGGTTFTTRATSPNIMDWSCDGSGSGGQAWYDLEIAASPTNAELIFAGGVNLWKSLDGGANWQITGHWYGGCGVQAVHADQHVFEYSPINNKLYIGNDGGIYSSSNNGSSWTIHTNGLVITQIYKIGQDRYDSTHLIFGAQDNGTSSFIGGLWYDTHGGDGMESIIDPEMPQYSYASVYYGDITRYTNNNSGMNIAANGNYGITEEGAWVTPYILDESDGNTMYIGYKNLWRGTDVRSYPSWQKISNNLGGTNSVNCKVVEQSSADPSILYFSREDGTLFRTDDIRLNQPTWVDLTSSLPASGNINDIETHPTLANTVFIVLNNKVYRSDNKGQSWQDITSNLPDVSFTTIELYKNANDGIYVGSNLGVWYRDASMTQWVNFSQGLPIDASINEIEIAYDINNPINDRIRVGTYGRGVWSSDVWRGTPSANFSGSPQVIPAGSQVQFTDLSDGVPSQWSWSFPGGTPSTSTAKNPMITYNTGGLYNVSLTVTNEAGTDTETKNNYIEVSSTILPAPGFYADKQNPCTGEVVQFTDTTLYSPNQWNWTFSPNTVTFVDGTSATSQNPRVLFQQIASYSVSLMATSPNGAASITRNDYIHTGGSSIPFYETFEEGTLSQKGWTVINPDNKNTWETANVSGTGPGTTAVRMPCYIYTNQGARDQLISPALNFTGLTDIYLQFEHAYAQRASLKDSLIIKVSTDCGNTWKQVFGVAPNAQGDLITAPASTSSFVPASSNDWCGGSIGAGCYTVDLSQFKGLNNVKIMFESYNKAGNNIYLDNISVNTNVGVGNITSAVNPFDIRPNPATREFTIAIPKEYRSGKLTITNTMGQVILSKSLNSNPEELIDPGKIASGAYTVTLSNEKESISSKLIIR